MLYMIVDAFNANGVVVASYPVTLEDVVGQSVTSDDFISQAKKAHLAEGLVFDNVSKWQVRAPG